jgi:hypothetical protein
LTILVKEESAVKLANDFIVPIILEFHHPCKLQSITCIMNLIKVLVMPVPHPFLVDPPNFINWLVLGEVDRVVPVHMEEGSELLVLTHPPVLIDRCLASCVECGEIDLLGIRNWGLSAILNWSPHLEGFGLLILILGWRRRRWWWWRRRRRR